NPQLQQNDPAPRLVKGRMRFPIVKGAIVAAGIGVILGGIMWLINSDRREVFGFESLTHYCCQTALGMALTGAVIVWVGDVPEFTGFLVGIGIMLLSAVVFQGGMGGWLISFMLCFGILGAVGGPIAGLAMRLMGYAK